MKRIVRIALVTGVVLLLAAVTAAPAAAGTYEITGCDSAPDGTTEGWFAPPPSFRMAAGGECPTGGDALRGLIARTQIAEADVPRDTAARAIFDAPPGTAIVGFKGSYSFMRDSGGWQVGLSNGNTLIRGCPPYDFPCEDTQRNVEFAIPASSRLYIEAFCARTQCPVRRSQFGRGGYQASAQLAATAIRIQDDSRPDLKVTGGNILSGEWISGPVTTALEAVDNSGVPAVEVTVGDAVPKTDRSLCPSAVFICPNQSGVATAPTTGLVSDGRNRVVVRAFDRAGNVADKTFNVLIDNAAPKQPLDVKAEGGEGFRRTNRFALRWRNPDQQDVAPIAAAIFEMCPVGVTSGAARCVRGERRGTEISEIADLELPSAGEWNVRVWLRDQAGNQNSDLSSSPLELGFDPDAPDVRIAGPISEDPGRINVLASDATSAVAKGELELRRQGAEEWRPMETELSRSGFSGVVDDERLPDGAYELRARAFDRAGNERSTTSFDDGATARVSLPLRIKTRLDAGRKGGRRGRGNTLVVRPRLPYGRGIRLHGRLTTPGANPLAAMPVEVHERVDLPGREFVPIGRIETSKTGRFSFRVASGPKRVLRFRFAGTRTVRPSAAEVDVRVRATSTIRVNRRAVVNGEDVVFRGRLGGRPFSPTSKLVQLQAYSRGRWLTFATPRADPQTGLWSHRYRFAATRGRVRYRFRVRVPREASYPFATGTSRLISVRVRGL